MKRSRTTPATISTTRPGAVQKDQSEVAGTLHSLSKRLAQLEWAIESFKPVIQSLKPVADELKSMADILRKIAQDMDTATFSIAKSRGEIESVKTELRLVRSDFSSMEKRLPTAETRFAV